MYPRSHFLSTAFGVLAVICIWPQIALSQKKPASINILNSFEKSIERGAVDEIERPLMDFAIANPNNPKALELLARVRLRQGRLSESGALYQRVLRLDPGSVSAKINSARIAYSFGQKEAASQFLDEIGQLNSLTPAVQLEVAAARFLIGDPQAALSMINGLPTNVRNTNGLPLLAAIYLQAGLRQELVDLIPLMTKTAAANPAVATQSAEVLQNAGLHKEGAELLRSLPPKAQNIVKILVLLGRLEVLSRDLESARAHLKRAEVLEPASPEVLSAKALLENALGHPDEALQLLTDARQIAPASTSILSDFVLMSMRQGKHQAAIDGAAKLMSMEPGNLEFEYLFGAASLQGGDLRSAQETLTRLAQKRPRDSRTCVALGLTLAAQRDQIENARKQLGNCIEIDPSNYEARYQLGLSYKSQGDNKQAIPYLEEVVNQRPNYTLALRDLGGLYIEVGDDAKARGILERAAALSPDDADIHFQLVRLYNRIGETALAKQHLETFQKLRGQWGKSAQ